MANRRVYHVISFGDLGWKVELAGSGDSEGRLFELKTQAIEHAKLLAQAAERGQVVIHDRSGRIQTEYTYGHGPVRKVG